MNIAGTYATYSVRGHWFTFSLEHVSETSLTCICFVKRHHIYVKNLPHSQFSTAWSMSELYMHTYGDKVLEKDNQKLYYGSNTPVPNS